MALDAHDKKYLRELFDDGLTFAQALEQMGEFDSQELSEAKALWNSFSEEG